MEVCLCVCVCVFLFLCVCVCVGMRVKRHPQCKVYRRSHEGQQHAEGACKAWRDCLSSQSHSVKTDARSMDTVVPEPYGKVTQRSLCIYVSRHLSLRCSGTAEWCEMGYTCPSLANHYRQAVVEKSKSLTVVCVVNILIWVPSPEAHGALF